MSSEPDEGRRTFLKIAGCACGAAAAGVVGVPAIRALVAPISKETVIGASGFVPTISPEHLPADGTPVVVSVVVKDPRDAWTKMPPTEIGSVFLRKDPGGAILAYSTICPHLGCQVDLDRAAKRMHCPCHDSAFSLDGAVVGGPSPRALDQLETRIEGGKIEVQYRRFKPGTHEKVPV